MSATVFVSYAHDDQQPIDWLKKLQMYLAPFRRAGAVDLWDDKQIEPGSDWRAAIDVALQRASAAVLLVGPAFIASDFIATIELPALLTARERGLRIFPLVVGYCAYSGSVLEPIQSFNDLARPLEALPPADQNKLLNDFSIAVGEATRKSQPPPVAVLGDDRRRVVALRSVLGDCDLTSVAFRAQNGRCRALVNAMTSRLTIREHLEFEAFFFRFADRMNEEERFEFQQIRAVTEGVLREGNQRMLRTIEDHPDLVECIPRLVGLRQHLVFWLNKFERVFLENARMCVCYVGVEDGVPWPNRPRPIEDEIRDWIGKHEV
jgi:hypothetical protein